VLAYGLAHEFCALTHDFHEVPTLHVIPDIFRLVCTLLGFYFTNTLHAIMQIQ